MYMKQSTRHNIEKNLDIIYSQTLEIELLYRQLDIPKETDLNLIQSKKNNIASAVSKIRLLVDEVK